MKTTARISGRPMLLLGALGWALLLSGCSTQSKNLWTLQEELDGASRRVEAARAMESARPAEAGQEYQRILLASKGLNEPLEKYQEKLTADLAALQSSKKLILRPDSLAAFIHHHARMHGLPVRARLGLARLALRDGQRAKAQEHAKEALELINKQEASRLFHCRETIEAYSLLEETYSKGGGAGKSLLARLQRQVVGDYLKSEQGRTDYFLMRQAYWDAQDAIFEVSNYVDRINTERELAAIDRFAMVTAAFGQAMSVVQQTQIDSALAKSGGRLTPEIRSIQMNKMVMDYSLNNLRAVQTGHGGGLDALLNPLSNLTLVSQLVDPKMGVNPFGIIKDFAGDAAQLDPGLGRAAKGVQQSADALSDTRKKGDPEKTKASAQDFIKVFSDFQAKVQEIGGRP